MHADILAGFHRHFTERVLDSGRLHHRPLGAVQPRARSHSLHKMAVGHAPGSVFLSLGTAGGSRHIGTPGGCGEKEEAVAALPWEKWYPRKDTGQGKTRRHQGSTELR